MQFSIHRRDSPMRNKGLACIGSRDGLNLNIWIQILILDSLNSELFGSHVYAQNIGTNGKFRSWFQGRAQTEIFVSRVPAYTQDLCQVHRWRGKSNFLRHQRNLGCTRKWLSDCFTRQIGRLPAHCSCWICLCPLQAGKLWVRIMLTLLEQQLCLQSQHMTLERQNTMTYLPGFNGSCIFRVLMSWTHLLWG